MPGTSIPFGISTEKVRITPSGIYQSRGGAQLTAGQLSWPGTGTAIPTQPIFDIVFVTGGGVGIGKVPGTAAVVGTRLSVMARIATQPGELRFFFGESVEGSDNETQFALLRQVENIPPVMVPADGTRWTVCAQALDISFCRFVIPVLVNIGAGNSGAWHVAYSVF